MDISIINELEKISADEIQLLNESVNKTITKENDFKEIINISKYERFLKRDVKNESFGEIIYMVVGSSRHNIDGKSITLKEGEFLLVNCNTQHIVNELANTDIAIKISIRKDFNDISNMRSDFLIRFLLDVLLNEDNKVKFLRFNVQAITPVRNIIENMIYSNLNKLQISEDTNVFYMELLLEHIKNDYSKLKFSSNARDIRMIVSVMSYIEANLRDGELNKISDQLSVSTYTLSKTIKKITGYNYKELLQIKKLDTAKHLLINTQMQISEIAEYIGYENTSYFHKIFKEKYNISPRKYRV